MTQYVYIPSEAPTGSAPSGFTERWNPTNYAISVGTERACPVQDRHYLLSQATALARWFASIDAIDSDGNRATCEVLTCFRDVTADPEATQQTDLGVTVRGSGSAASETGYLFQARSTNNQVRIVKLSAGTASVVGTPATKTITSNVWYFLRAYASGSTLRVRAWQAGTAEPGSWDVDTTDSAITAAGWIGLQFGVNAAAAGSARFGFISVGTNGDPALTPLLRSQWQAWLKQDAAERVLLAEIGMMNTATPTTKYLANAPFQSKSYDSPASQAYAVALAGAPSYSARASELVTGQTTITIGELLVNNADGSRDAWLKANVDGRDVKVLLGSPSWPRYDFRPICVAVSEYIRNDGLGRIALVLRDKQRLVDRAISTTTIASGVNAGRMEPIVVGEAYWVEPAAIDAATLEYHVHNGTCQSIGDAYDGGVALTSSPTISSVNGGTETITTTAAHGMVAGWTVTVPASTGNLVAGTTYHVISAGLTSTDLRLSATPGGAAFNLAGTETGTLTGKGRRVDLATGKVYLAQTPTSELRIDQVTVDASSQPTIMATVLTGYCGLSGSIDTASMVDASGETFDQCGMYITERTNAIEVMDKLAADFAAAWGFDRAGLAFLAPLQLPANSITLAFAEYEIEDLRLERVLMPYKSTQVRSKRNANPSTQFLASVSATERTRRSDSHYIVTDYSSLDGTDSQANHLLAQQQRVIDSHSNGSSLTARHINQFKRKAAIWSFATNLRALDLRIGDKAQITYSRFGFSPLTCYVLAIEDDIARARVRLTVLAQSYSQAAAP